MRSEALRSVRGMVTSNMAKDTLTGARRAEPALRGVDCLRWRSYRRRMGESFREGLPVLLGGGVAGLVNAVAWTGLRRWRPAVMAALLLLAGAAAAAINGELGSWPNGLFAVAIDSVLAGLGALVCTRLLRRRSAARAARTRAASLGEGTPPSA